MKSKKGVGGIEFLAPIMITLTIAAIVAVVAMTIIGDTRTDLISNTPGCNATDQTACGAALNSTISADAGISNVTSRMGLIGTVAGFGIVLAVLGFFLGRQLLGF